MNPSEQRNLTKKQMLLDLASKMSSSAKQELRNFIDELGLTIVNVTLSNNTAL